MYSSPFNFSGCYFHLFLALLVSSSFLLLCNLVKNCLMDIRDKTKWRRRSKTLRNGVGSTVIQVFLTAYSIPNQTRITFVISFCSFLNWKKNVAFLQHHYRALRYYYRCRMNVPAKLLGILWIVIVTKRNQISTNQQHNNVHGPVDWRYQNKSCIDL